MDDQDFIYERRFIPGGIKIETVTGGKRYKGRVWLEMARQIYCENGREGYREIGHYSSGAPFIYDADERISISHTEGCFVVATIKVPDDAVISEFSEATALGIDVEKARREKVMGVRSRFLTDSEMHIVPAESVESNVIAWTAKEAMLKAGMNPSVDWHNDIVIDSLPDFSAPGKGHIILNGRRIHLNLQSEIFEEYVITVASTRTAVKHDRDVYLKTKFAELDKNS